MKPARLNRELLEQLTRPGARLPALERWLLDEVWTQAALEASGRSPKEYLRHGEEIINARENLLRSTAPSLFDELTSMAGQERTIGAFFAQRPESAVVVFDGCSLREMPRLLELARVSRREVLDVGCGRTAVPSETEWFISDRLGLGLPTIGPSQLSGRGELKQRNVRFYYYRQTTDHHSIQDGQESFLLWSRFPDQRYTDSTATDESMAWKRTIQAVPHNRTVLVTSDHGYIFLGSGLSDPRLKGADRRLEGKRFRFFEPFESLPANGNGLWIDASRRLGVLAGRGHNRFQGPGGQSVYRHGGLTLMEMLRPWLVLGPVQ